MKPTPGAPSGLIKKYPMRGELKTFPMRGHLSWGDTKPANDRVVEIFGADCQIMLWGDPATVATVAKLICSIVNSRMGTQLTIEPGQIAHELVRGPNSSSDDPICFACGFGKHHSIHQVVAVEKSEPVQDGDGA